MRYTIWFRLSALISLAVTTKVIADVIAALATAKRPAFDDKLLDACSVTAERLILEAFAIRLVDTTKLALNVRRLSAIAVKLTAVVAVIAVVTSFCADTVNVAKLLATMLTLSI